MTLNPQELREPRALTADLARELLAYDPSTGALTWKPRKPAHFTNSPDVTCARWNGRNAGKLVPSGTSSHGYTMLSVQGRMHYAHRVIWLLVTGRWPANEIDHINGDRADNRFENLREATPTEQRRNAHKRFDNTSGFTGVKLRNGKYVAQIGLAGQVVHLGTFDCGYAALKARRAAEQVHGYSGRHGR